MRGAAAARSDERDERGFAAAVSVTMTIVYPSPRKPIRYTVVESILPRVLYVLQDAGVARRWRLALRVAVCFARRRRLAAVAVLLQREVAELWEALSGGGTRAGDRCCDIDRRRNPITAVSANMPLKPPLRKPG